MISINRCRHNPFLSLIKAEDLKGNPGNAEYPALVQESMSVLSLCECIDDKEMGIDQGHLLSIGKVMVLPEKYMDAVTAVSGSGPAFIALFVEKMTEAGVHAGLSQDNASELAIQTS